MTKDESPQPGSRRRRESMGDEKQIFRKEIVVIRWSLVNQEHIDDNSASADEYKVDELEILTEYEFMERFGQRSVQNYKGIRYVQTVVKSRTGLGTPITIHFYAPAPKRQNKGDSHETISYDFKSMKSDYELLKQNKDYEFCYK